MKFLYLLDEDGIFWKRPVSSFKPLILKKNKVNWWDSDNYRQHYLQATLTKKKTKFFSYMSVGFLSGIFSPDRDDF